MVRHHPDNRLKAAFLGALVLHAAALLALAWVPAVRTGGGGIDEIRVFGDQAPVAATPVALVSWEEAKPAPVPAAVPAPAPQPVAAPRPVEPARPSPTPRAHRGRPAAAVTAPPHPHAAAPRGPAHRLPGGGGGGSLDLGSTSSRGQLPVPGEHGSTGPGQVPGTGAGSGSGEGAGRGGGSGGGSGGGTGAATGTGSGGEAAGPAGAPATAPGEESKPKPPPRVADRAEPEVIAKGRLAYPEEAQSEGVEGTVILQVVVTEQGTVARVEVSRSSGDRRLDKAATEFVRGWRYRPAIQDGKPRRVTTRATVRFELR